MKALTLKPRLSEKTYALSEKLNTYVFEVPRGANKQAIADAVATTFEVKVKAVRVANVKGKNQKVYRRGGRNVQKGSRSDIRKAYVSLEKGHKLPIFSAVEESSSKPDSKEKK